MHLFIGDKDFLYSTAQDWRAAFDKNQVKYDYIEYPGIGHNSWEYAYRDAYIFEWFSQFKRDMFPQQVSFSSRQFKYNKAYWVTLDKLVPGTLATINAKFTGAMLLRLLRGRSTHSHLNLQGHPQFQAGKSLQVKIDGLSLM